MCIHRQAFITTHNRTINDEEFTNPGFEVTGEVNGEKPQFQCIG